MPPMSKRELRHLYPTLKMVAEELNRTGLTCRVERDAKDTCFRAARRYSPGDPLSPNVLYVLSREEAQRVQDRSLHCVSPVPVGGEGGCLLCMNRTEEEILNALLTCFENCARMESELDDLIYANADLRLLCEYGAGLLENPICVHDDWFVMVARSSELPQVLPPDYVMSSSREFIPRVIIEDFENDSEYLETFAHREARVWDPGLGEPKYIYVNLWDAEIYRGRMLVVEHHRSFRQMDLLIAQVLAQRAMALMNFNRPGTRRAYRSMDDIVLDLLEGRRVEANEEGGFLDMMRWGRRDPMLVIRMEPQEPSQSTLIDHALHSDLFRTFPKSYILFSGHQQCVLLDLRQESAEPALLRSRLSPVCRDYCLYAGLSSPVTGMEELPVAFEQAKVALEKAFRCRDERWMISFSDCALEYLLQSARTAMPLKHLVAPELVRLMEIDREKDTRYYETLRTYLLNERNIPATSAALIIHRTTLLYRLRKIRSLVSMDTDDPDKRLHLLLSLKILDRDDHR